MAFAASGPDKILCTTAGKENFQRLTRLLICGGTSLLREIFDHHCPPSHLPTRLKNPATETLLNTAKLTKPQRDCLYPSPGVYGESEHFDLTLLFKLLRTICGLTPPPTGWDAPPVASDLSLTADLVRIKNFRNTVYGHVHHMEITDDDFNLLWDYIKQTLLRIAGQISSATKRNWQKAIKKFFRAPLTQEDERNVQELKRWYEEDVEVKKSLDDLKVEIEGLKEEIKKINSELGKIHQVLVEEFSSIAVAGSEANATVLSLTIDCQTTPEQSEQNGFPTTQAILNLVASNYLANVNPSTREELNDFVQYLLEVRKVLIVGTHCGSLIIKVKCSTLEILEDLWDDYCIGHLNEMAQKHLVTEEILTELGLTELILTTSISDEKYRECKNYFLNCHAVKENFQRLTRLLICGGTSLLREIFDHHCPPSHLPTRLRNPAMEDLMLNREKLTKPQRDCLYPSPGVYGESKDFDLTLLCKLLRTICGLTPPPTGWDAPPATSDLSLTADLVRIKNFRNTVYGHVHHMDITDDDFNFLWDYIKQTLLRIAGQISSTTKSNWQTAINNFLTAPLTKEDERNVQELKRWYEEDVEVKESLDDLKVEIEGLKEETKKMSSEPGEMHEVLVGFIAVADSEANATGLESDIGNTTGSGESAEEVKDVKKKKSVELQDVENEELDDEPKEKDATFANEGPPWTKENRPSSNTAKKIVAAASVGVPATAAGVLAAPVIAGAALGAAGFTSAGVAAGSIAAGVQSAVYGGSVAAGSLFALCQSAGATGVIGSAATAVIGGGTGLAGIAGTLGSFKLFGRKTDTLRLVICGSEDGAHVFACIASSRKDTDVRVLSLHDDEAKRWEIAMPQKQLEVAFLFQGEKTSGIVSKPDLVTNNPEDAMRDAEMVVFMMHASCHQVYLQALAPHIKPGTIIVGLPGNPEFESQVRHVLGEKAQQCTIMNFDSLPWTCQTSESGVACEVVHTMDTLMGNMMKGIVPPKKDPVAALQYLLGPLPELKVSDRT